METLPEEAEERNAYEYVEWMEMLACLEEKYRIVLVLYYGEGFSVKEIARVLGISQSAVKQRLFVARKQMEKQFGYLQENRCI